MSCFSCRNRGEHHAYVSRSTCVYFNEYNLTKMGIKAFCNVYGKVLLNMCIPNQCKYYEKRKD